MDIGSIASTAGQLQRTAEDRPSVSFSSDAGIKAAPVQTVDAVQQPSPALGMGQVKQAVQDINKSLHAPAQGLQFSIDEDSGTTVIKLIDTETMLVLRQIPTVEVMEISKALGKLQGLLVKEQA